MSDKRFQVFATRMFATPLGTIHTSHNIFYFHKTNIDIPKYHNNIKQQEPDTL